VSRIEFTCPACRGVVLAPPSLAGESATCPKCGADVDYWRAPESKPATSKAMPRRIPYLLFLVPIVSIIALCLFAVLAYHLHNSSSRGLEATPESSSSSLESNRTEGYTTSQLSNKNIIITGRLEVATNGINEWLEVGPGSTLLPDATPILYVRTKDGTLYHCAFVVSSVPGISSGKSTIHRGLRFLSLVKTPVHHQRNVKLDSCLAARW